MVNRQMFRVLLAALAALLIAACGADAGGVRESGTAPAAAPATSAPATEATSAPAAEATSAPVDEATAAAGQGAGEPYKLGAVLSITGAGSSLGVPERDTLLMLQTTINEAGGIQGPDGMMHEIQLEIVDDESKEPQAVLATRRLLESGVLGIIGSTQTGQSIAMIPIITEAQVPMISLAGSAAVIEPIAERAWVFKTAQNDRLVMSVLMNELKNRSLTDVAFLSVNNAFGDAGRGEFEKAAQTNGINIVLEDRYAPEETDASSQVTSIKSSTAKALVNWAVSPPSAVVSKNAYDLGLTIPIYQSHGIGNQAFIDLAGPAADGVRFAGGKLLVAGELPDDDPQKAVLTEYAQQYTATYNAPISTFGGHAYDAFYIMVEALGRSGADSVKLRDEIENTKEFVGISGVFNYTPEDHHGLDERALTMIEIKGGKWTLSE